MNAEVLTTRRSDIFSRAQSNSLWTLPLGLSCCTLEFMSVSGPRYDWQRFGSTIKTNPKDSDLLIIAGPITTGIQDEIKKIYDEMPNPKYVISVGSCANSGGMFASGDEGAVVPGSHNAIPIDLYIPGCPPRPEALIHALLRLQERIQHAGS